jgi:hypothetical protein
VCLQYKIKISVFRVLNLWLDILLPGIDEHENIWGGGGGRKVGWRGKKSIHMIGTEDINCQNSKRTLALNKKQITVFTYRWQMTKEYFVTEQPNKRQSM